jgi:hypothetical protein
VHPFMVGWEYTRFEIREPLGGSLGDSLPHKDGRVVAGCFQPEMNPDAPAVVLPGTGPQVLRWSEQFSQQTEPVPVFLKTGPNRWRYAGQFRVAGRSLDPAVITEHARRSGRTDISQVLFLEAAGDETQPNA